MTLPSGLLDQAILAHKNGSLKEADQLYTRILSSDPLHPDANHNLGLLAKLVKDDENTLRLLNTAISQNFYMKQ